MCVRCAWWFSSPSLHFSSSWDISADLLCPARFSIFMKEKKGAVELMGRSCKSGTGSSSSFPRVDFGNLFSPHPYYVFIFSCLPFNEMKLTRYIHPRAMVALGGGLRWEERAIERNSWRPVSSFKSLFSCVLLTKTDWIGEVVGRSRRRRFSTSLLLFFFFNDFPFYCALDFSLVMVYSKLLVASRTGTV